MALSGKMRKKKKKRKQELEERTQKTKRERLLAAFPVFKRNRERKNIKQFVVTRRFGYAKSENPKFGWWNTHTGLVFSDKALYGKLNMIMIR